MRHALFLLLVGILLACNNQPAKVETQSKNFEIQITRDGYILKIKHKSKTYQYSFARNVKRDNRVKIPVTSVAVMSSTHTGFISALTEQNTIIAASGKKYIYNPQLRRRLDSIAELGFAPNIDYEKLLLLKPQILFVNSIDNIEPAKLKLLRQAGITVIPTFEYLENNPLARLEWIKVFGVVYDRLTQATAYYDSVAVIYNSLCDSVKKLDVSQKPKILVNIPYRRTWYVPGGRSYMARFITDAGGDYPWANTAASFSIPMSFEQVFSKASDADILINPGTATSIKQILEQEPRMELFRAVREKQVWNNNKLASPQGGSAFWESGTVRPDRILSDLIRIFYPGNTFTPDTLTYYQKLQ